MDVGRGFVGLVWGGGFCGGCSSCPTEVDETKTLLPPVFVGGPGGGVVGAGVFPSAAMSWSMAEVPGGRVVAAGVWGGMGGIGGGKRGLAYAGVGAEGVGFEPEPPKREPPRPCPSCIPIIICIMLPKSEPPPKSEPELPDDPPDDIEQREGGYDLSPRY